MMASVTTDDVPARERAAFWEDLVSRHVTPIHIGQVGGCGLRGEIEARPLGEVAIAAVAGVGIRAEHTRGHVGRAATHFHAACVILDGHMRFTRHGDTLALQPGDIFITDSRREFALDLERPWRHLVFALPCDWLDSRVARPASIAGVVVRGRALARLWATQLQAGFVAAPHLTPGAAALVARQSLELLAELLNERGADRPAPVTAHGAVFASACHVITLTCSNPHVTPATIARAIGVSTRTLARAFAERNESVMRRVYGERLQRAADLLASPESRHRTITDIAFACGFNDVSHFGRLFSASCQMTPSQWRLRAR
jgi:AraC family transcriptional regulator, positive regulator of tynA and feaB